MKMKNLAVGALAAVLTLALWWNFLLKPARSEATSVKADTEVQKSKLQPLQAQLDQANAAAAHAGTFKAQLAALQRAVPDSPALAAWIRGANGVAVDSHIFWQSITHGPPTLSTAATWQITLGIQIKGTYPQVIDYIGRLAKLSRLVVVDGVTLTTSSDTGAGTGAGASGPGASTGPFSGGSELSGSITARMFETPPTGTADASGTGATSTPAAGGSTTGSGSTLNNS